MKRYTSKTYRFIILVLFSILLGVLDSCATHRAIRLRNKSLKKWEPKKEQTKNGLVLSFNSLPTHSRRFNSRLV